jgi:hypothetical protein
MSATWNPSMSQPDRRAARHRELLRAAAVAHRQWRDECAAVRSAYHRWAGPRSAQKPVAFHAYGAALDREERATNRCARRIGSAGDVEREEPIALPAKGER